MTTDEFRRVGHEIIELIAHYRETLAAQPVMAQVTPGELRQHLPKAPPEAATPPEQLLSGLATVLERGLTHFQHPMFYGYFPANAELSSVLGDLLSSGLGQLGLNWQASPALTELEAHMTDWFRQLLGLPERFEGVIQDTASTSSLVALISARERASNYSLAAGGLQAVAAPLVVYTSSQSHSSVEKAALLAGFGRDNVRMIAVDDRFALSVSALERAVQLDLERGLTPCAIVATTGTTATTACDPIAEVAALAAHYGLWLHVDGAMAGSAMLLPECRHLWQGIEQADSLVINPHKWLGAVFDCSLYYVRNSEHLVRVMSTNPSYLQTAQDGAVTNYRDWGIPLGRRFRALKLWFLLQSEGAEGLRARLRRDLENAQWLAERVRQAPDWELLAPVQLQTVCVRHVPAALSAAQLNDHTLAWVAALNASGEAYLTPAKLGDRWMVRVSIGALGTEREHIEKLWRLMQRVAAETQHRENSKRA